MAVALRFMHLLAMIVWIGGVISFSFLTAPALFATLPREMAGRATAAIFPRYYLLGGACAIVAILSTILIGHLERGWDNLRRAELLLLVLMTLATLYAGHVILPEASRLRLALPGLEGTPEHDAARVRFGALHRRSVLLNGMVLVMGIGTVFIASLRGLGENR